MKLTPTIFLKDSNDNIVRIAGAGAETVILKSLSWYDPFQMTFSNSHWRQYDGEFNPRDRQDYA